MSGLSAKRIGSPEEELGEYLRELIPDTSEQDFGHVTQEELNAEEEVWTPPEDSEIAQQKQQGLLSENSPPIKAQEYNHSLKFYHDGDEEARLAAIPTEKVMTAYQDYFDMGPSRSLAELARRYRKTAEEYGAATVPCVSVNTLAKWKKMYDWELQIRADSMDLYETRMQARKENAIKMVERQSGYSRVIQQMGFNFLRSMLDENGNLTPAGSALFTPSEARRFILDGAKLEKDLYGQEKQVINDDDEIKW